MQQRTVDNYTIEAELGHGGMAVVYRALDERLGRHVALKVLHEHIASREENRERFEREARAVARLEHPNIIRVYGFSSPSAPIQYIATELIDGPTLREQIERRPFAHPEVAAMACLSIARALGHAHREGIIHRDLKPENIMFTSAGVPRLMDFGLARVLDAQKLTQTGSILGSPAHMSPEIIEGLPVDARADVFAFGTVLYYATCGRLPFDGRNPAVILNAILGGDYAEPERINPRVSPAIARIIARCLQTDPEARYADGDEIAVDLAAALADVGISDPEAEFRAWWADPDAGDDDLHRRLVASWLARGREARDRGQIARALACVDRVLALDPHHDGALTLLEETRRARRRAGALLAALVVAVVIGAMAALVGPVQRWLAAPDPGLDAGLATIADVTDDGTGEGSAQALGPVLAEVQPFAGDDAGGFLLSISRDARESLIRGRAVAEASDGVVAALADADAALDEEVARRRAEQQRERERERETEDVAVVELDAGTVEPDVVEVTRELASVVFRVSPRAAIVELDGRTLGEAGDLNGEWELPVGRYVLAAYHSRRPDVRVEQEFEVIAGERPTIALDVPWPAAILVVDSNVAGQVLFGGVAVGLTGEPILVPIDGPDRTITVNFSVVRADVGGEPYQMTTELTAGEPTNVTVRF